MEEGNPMKAKRWIEAITQGRLGREIETRGIQGLKILQARKNLMKATFVVPENLADKDGNWHIGAIAILIDNIGAAAIGSSIGEVKASVNFNVSYLSTVKIEEEVEIEAKVLNHKEKLSSVMVEIRRKENGEMVALGKQWMISTHGKDNGQMSQEERLSKL